MFQSLKFSLIIGLIGVLLAGCASPTPTVVPVVAPTATAAPTVTPPPTIAPSDSERKLTVVGTERSYLLHIPPGVGSLQPVPVVFAFHGFSSDASTMQLLTGFNEIADKAGFLVVYPNGIGRSWSAGGCCGYAVEKNVDEIAFVRQILTDLGKVVNIDPKRVYAAGWSNGAMLSYRLACEMSDTFAAIAPVSGALFYSSCQPDQAVSIIQVHGLMDTIVPYDGGKSSFMANIAIPPVTQGITTWLQLNSCPSSAEVKTEGAVFTHYIYAPCKTDTAVELYTFNSGGHDWPSKYITKPSMSEIIWNFFASHSKP